MLAGIGAVRAADTSTPQAAAPAAAIATPAVTHRVPDFADLVTAARPAVVSITTEVDMKAEAGDDAEGGMPMPFAPRGGHAQHAEAKGSGFIISDDGLVVTNNHVVDGAKSITVTLDDGTDMPAKLLGRDARTDLALLKVSGDHKLPFLQLGESNKVRPGEWVVAVGNPFGLGGTVTAGIVSALNRDIGSGPYDHFLQIDAPINRGNSGGPLFSQDGRVVGVNTAILSPSGGSIGIGFAIPADTVRTVVADLQKFGHVTRGYLGVETQPVTAAMAAALRLPKAADGGKSDTRGNGALVASVAPDSPAAKAGLQAGDVIRSVGGTAVVTPRDLAARIADVAPGQDAALEIVRDGKTQTVTASVGNLADDKTASAESPADKREQVGLALAPLSPDARGELDLPEKTRGVLVAEVKPDSPADRAGIQQGDVIVAVGAHKVGSPSEAVTAIHAAVREQHAVALRVLRDGRTSFVAIDMNKAGAGASSDEG